MSNFQFNQKQVENEFEKYKDQRRTEFQEQLIQDCAQLIIEKTGINSKLLNGFMHIAIISWQQENDMDLKEVEQFHEGERAEVFRKISKKLKFMLRSTLVKADQWEQLEFAIDESFVQYKKKWKMHDTENK